MLLYVLPGLTESTRSPIAGQSLFIYLSDDGLHQRVEVDGGGVDGDPNHLSHLLNRSIQKGPWDSSQVQAQSFGHSQQTVLDRHTCKGK